MCHISYGVYDMNLQYVGKNETPFSIRLNNHRKDLKDAKTILVDKHFQSRGHRFNKHVRFMIICRLTNTNLDKEILRERFSQRQNFWVQKLQSLYLKGLNQELKCALSGLRLLVTESPLKMMKNVFYFTSKALFVLKIFKFCHVSKRLD